MQWFKGTIGRHFQFRTYLFLHFGIHADIPHDTEGYVLLFVVGPFDDGKEGLHSSIVTQAVRTSLQKKKQ